MRKVVLDKSQGQFFPIIVLITIFNQNINKRVLEGAIFKLKLNVKFTNQLNI
jgi:hypothetical protein